jgi:hypothetical protein
VHATLVKRGEAVAYCSLDDVAEERARNSRSALDTTVGARDAALVAFPYGVDAALTATRSALATAIREKEEVAIEFASLEQAIEARKKRIEEALSGARTKTAQAKAAVDTAQTMVTTAKTNHAEECTLST